MNTKQNIVLWTILALMVIIVFLLVLLLVDKSGNDQVQTTTNTPSVEMMNLTLYVQDRVLAAKNDCSVTEKVTVQVPKTLSVIDTSLKILFGGELSRYGVYKSVIVNDGLARVILESENTPSGNPISSLSSCESSHLMSVLRNTLMQYDNVLEVQLESPKGKIDF